MTPEQLQQLIIGLVMQADQHRSAITLMEAKLEALQELLMLHGVKPREVMDAITRAARHHGFELDPSKRV